MKERETFASRLGFILISAGCAIGLGNVWRFPYITGLNGGALFVLIYLFFLLFFGIPIMTMEFAVGRGSRRSVARSFNELEPKGTKWHIFRWFAMGGNYLLMMFYTTISGWMLAYLFFMVRGDFVHLSSPEDVGAVFDALTGNPGACIGWMVTISIIGFAICAIGLQKGVERVTKVMMSALFVIMIVLVIRAVTLPNAMEGLKFYLSPNTAAIQERGLWPVIYDAMGQAFFTLSIGMGSMAIFGSYINKDRSLLGESINITILDTSVALMAGLIIFPACASFGINPGAGPGLVFVTLPNIFRMMPMGQVWGILFFIFMVFAALSTVIAVFENILSFATDLTGMSRQKACLVNAVALIILAIPCALGFNLWSGFAPLGPGSLILDLEDFIVSKNILPIGSVIYVLFCTFKNGWGWDKFMEEANTGKGLKFPKGLRFYTTYILPLIVLIVFVFGYLYQFFIKSA